MTTPTTDTSREAVERGMSVSMLTKLIHCDPDNGILTWRERAHDVHPSWSAGRLKAWNSRYAGTPALSSVCKVNGYKTGYVMGRAFRSHRVVWAMTYGRWPENHIDHVNGDKTDNRIENLRDITNEENTRNARYVRSGRSIVPGVQWVPRLNKWQARIGGHDLGRYIGVYSCVGMAISARKAAQIEAGYMPDHGKLRASE